MVSKLTTYTLTGTIAADGTASATTDNPVKGYIVAVEIDYPAATCTVDLDAAGTHTQKVMDLAAANTDRTVYPRVQVHDNTGTGVTYDGTNEIYEKFAVNGVLTLSIASGTATQVVTVRVIVEEY